MACNTIFGAGDYMIGPPKPDMTFTLSKCDLVTLDPLVHDLIMDIELLTDIVTVSQFFVQYSAVILVQYCEHNRVQRIL